MKPQEICGNCKENLAPFFLYCPKCGTRIAKVWMKENAPEPKAEKEEEFALHTEYFHGRVCAESIDWEEKTASLHKRFGYCGEYLYERVNGVILRYHPKGEMKRIYSEREEFRGDFLRQQLLYHTAYGM